MVVKTYCQTLRGWKLIKTKSGWVMSISPPVLSSPPASQCLPMTIIIIMMMMMLSMMMQTAVQHLCPPVGHGHRHHTRQTPACENVFYLKAISWKYPMTVHTIITSSGCCFVLYCSQAFIGHGPKVKTSLTALKNTWSSVCAFTEWINLSRFWFYSTHDSDSGGKMQTWQKQQRLVNTIAKELMSRPSL